MIPVSEQTCWLQLAIVRKIYSRLISDYTDIRPRMLYNCRVSFIMKYCTVVKLEIILSTESEMVWPCESRAQQSARLWRHVSARHSGFFQKIHPKIRNWLIWPFKVILGPHKWWHVKAHMNPYIWLRSMTYFGPFSRYRPFNICDLMVTYVKG